MAYQDDKYENFMNNLSVGRSALLKFAEFTLAATRAPGVEASIIARAAGLRTAYDAYLADVVQRTGAGGQSKAGTATEQQAFETFKAFIQHYHGTALGGYLHQRPNDAALYYPDQLSGLTQADKEDRLKRLTAYTEALKKGQKLPAKHRLPDVPLPLDAPDDAEPKRPGDAAAALLEAYEIAAGVRNTGRTTLKKETTDLTPAAKLVKHWLFGVHCAALDHHWEDPAQARQYFDYAHLPHRLTTAGRKSATKKTT